MYKDCILFSEFFFNKNKKTIEELTEEEFNNYYAKKFDLETKKLRAKASQILAKPQFKDIRKGVKINHGKNDDELDFGNAYIIDRDLWSFNPKASMEDSSSEEFYLKYYDLVELLQKEISDKNLFSIEDDGDWDTGCAILSLNMEESKRRLG